MSVLINALAIGTVVAFLALLVTAMVKTSGIRATLVIWTGSILVTACVARVCYLIAGAVMGMTQVSQQNKDGSWSVAVPCPFYNGLLWFWRGLYVCECGAKFWREASYEKHYRENYTDDDHGMPKCRYCGRTGCVGSCQL